jgi:hypothetical protein
MMKIWIMVSFYMRAGTTCGGSGLSMRCSCAAGMALQSPAPDRRFFQP